MNDITSYREGLLSPIRPMHNTIPTFAKEPITIRALEDTASDGNTSGSHPTQLETQATYSPAQERFNARGTLTSPLGNQNRKEQMVTNDTETEMERLREELRQSRQEQTELEQALTSLRESHAAAIEEIQNELADILSAVRQYSGLENEVRNERELKEAAILERDQARGDVAVLTERCERQQQEIARLKKVVVDLASQ